MTTYFPTAGLRGQDHGDTVPLQIARSVLATSGLFPDFGRFHQWLTDQKRHASMEVRVVPLDELTGWHTHPVTGNIAHESGRFYSVEGLDVRIEQTHAGSWQQPILNQPEVGILGILVKEFDGVLHFLMQAKVEPGNHNGLQLSPTVQATRSNFTRVHRGARVPYLDYFRDTSRHQVLADVRQSEQGSWFHRKRNRNMVVRVEEDIELRDGFCWLTLGQLHRLLAADDLVNMDARTVLSCLPFAATGLSGVYGSTVASPFTSCLVRSCEPEAAEPHTMNALLGWITEVRSGLDSHAERIPLRDVEGWRRADGRIARPDGAFFTVVGVQVSAVGREVRTWSQPMIQPCDEGVCAFLVKKADGVLQVLVQAKAEPGFVDVVELAPTVQCTPSNHDALPGGERPPYLTEVLDARPEQIRFDAVHSEEGGRFFHARNRYLVVEVAEDFDAVRPGYRWVTLAQLSALLRHSHYLNVEARSLVACLHTLSVRPRPAFESAAED
ncbi:NDP-hexose 2,3-dehydratase family protein [Streptomyces sp. NPDC001820]|uniref:NDP-hexose 2,3-dehydratase family protein n=1 Tax=Streptomyces sp. NPDC001820 TaxID=3364613 RepID=UPI0036A8ECA3